MITATKPQVFYQKHRLRKSYKTHQKRLCLRNLFPPWLLNLIKYVLPPRHYRKYIIVMLYGNIGTINLQYTYTVLCTVIHYSNKIWLLSCHSHIEFRLRLRLRLRLIWGWVWSENEMWLKWSWDEVEIEVEIGVEIEVDIEVEIKVAIRLSWSLVGYFGVIFIWCNNFHFLFFL